MKTSTECLQQGGLLFTGFTVAIHFRVSERERDRGREKQLVAKALTGGEGGSMTKQPFIFSLCVFKYS